MLDKLYTQYREILAALSQDENPQITEITGQDGDPGTLSDEDLRLYTEKMKAQGPLANPVWDESRVSHVLAKDTLEALNAHVVDVIKNYKGEIKDFSPEAFMDLLGRAVGPISWFEIDDEIGLAPNLKAGVFNLNGETVEIKTDIAHNTSEVFKGKYSHTPDEYYLSLRMGNQTWISHIYRYHTIDSDYQYKCYTGKSTPEQAKWYGKCHLKSATYLPKSEVLKTYHDFEEWTVDYESLKGESVDFAYNDSSSISGFRKMVEVMGRLALKRERVDHFDSSHEMLINPDYKISSKDCSDAKIHSRYDVEAHGFFSPDSTSNSGSSAILPYNIRQSLPAEDMTRGASIVFVLGELMGNHGGAKAWTLAECLNGDPHRVVGSVTKPEFTGSMDDLLEVSSQFKFPPFKHRVIHLDDVIDMTLANVRMDKDGSRMPKIGYDKDTLYLAKAILKTIPYDQWDAVHMNYSGSEITIRDLFDQYEKAYLSSGNEQNLASVFYHFDHTTWHLPALLLAYYDKKGEDPQVIKDVFLARELGIESNKIFDKEFTMGTFSQLAHYAESLGLLLDHDKISWKPEEIQKIKVWLVDVRDYVSQLDIVSQSQEIAHLIKGLRLIEKNEFKLN